MPIDIRQIGTDEIEAFVLAMSGPFAFDLPDDDDDRKKMFDRFSSTFEVERARCAFDGPDMVGTLGAFTLDLTVPGGAASCAGTTMVTVLASHRRRGVLRQLMTAHFEEARERGDPIAGLWASDAAIYGRFGFGLASVGLKYEIDPRHAQFHRLAPEPSQARFMDAATAAEILPQVYDAVRKTRPGMFARSDTWWRHQRLHDRPDRRDGATAFRFVISHAPDGSPNGYAQFRVKEGWEGGHGAHEVRIVEIIGTEASAFSGLLKVVMGHDLATKITAWGQPVDDPVFDLLASNRRATPELSDALWICLLDVPAALTARHYDSAGAAVMRIHDPIAGNPSSWLLETDGIESTCVPTDRAPDVELDLEDLGSAYLGRARFRELVRAGRVVADGETARRLDEMFTWDPQPWCPEVF